MDDINDMCEGKNIIIGIPAYNEAKSIGDIITQAKEFSTQVIVCDDGSVDDTKEISIKNGAQVIRHNHNMGYGAAIKTLFDAAKERNADVLITLDSDGQHNVNDIKKLLKTIMTENVDIVIGSRYLNKTDSKKIPFYRNIGIKTITKFTQATSFNKITDAQSGFRAYNGNAIKKINLVEKGMGISTEILVRANENDLKILEVPITIRYDVENSSTHNPVRHGIGVLTTVIRFASIRHPLLFYAVPGIAFITIAVGFMAFALEMFSETRFVSTNSILISIGSAIVGMMLIGMGIILYSMNTLFDDKIGHFRK